MKNSEGRMRSLRVTVIGGGPAGLFLARLLRLADPDARVQVHERNGADDAFGFGVVFSARTMWAFEAADPETHALITAASVSWSDMELRQGDSALRYGGYGFTAISRRTLLKILQEQSIRAGAEIDFHSGLTWESAAAEADVVAIADGVGSANRDALAGKLGSRVEPGAAKFIWFGTTASFDAVTFPFVRNEHGAFAAHAYPYGGGMSTFIVETDQDTWLSAGMDASTLAAQVAGDTDEYSRRYLTELFAEHLGGRELVGNKSYWANFRLVHNENWWHENAVLLGDAAHTAHFSVGSGTKLAMEDAIVLSGALMRSDRTDTAFAQYHHERRGAVARTQDAAALSMRWWETFDARLSMPSSQFGLHFITRTAAISYTGLRRRHADRIDEAERAFAAGKPANSAMQVPLRLGPIVLNGRFVSVLGGDPAEHAALALACAATGSSLVLADRMTDPSPVDHAEWKAVNGKQGCTFGVFVGSENWQRQAEDFVAAGATVLGACADGQDASPFPHLIAIAGQGVSVLAVLDRLSADEGTAWSARGDRRIEQCVELGQEGVNGIYLRSPEGCEPWPSLLDEAERIRTETGLPVLVDGPTDWALSVSAAPNRDDWPTRLHLALVTGRVDLIAAWPLRSPTCHTF
ncbi:FAD-dependent monooxygenase [Amycolatopsis sp. H20-H5]|uniref:FAD-dependent monooxygenase n=1 Tax=Amycolatopsis sp. H20-H5 TaxID=3046309 RepID=UPI002DB7E01F|nr:FAD-dependent monooxygenase [Amycolatopsis sp. H20-H5]MEC3982035.1 FAD-dependent monooxygenase [Amycolatopsis sp. H20-H5]